MASTTKGSPVREYPTLASSSLQFGSIEEGDLESVVSGESGTQTDEQGTTERTPEIGSKETRWVNYSKVLVIVVIFIVAASMGLFTYRYVSDQEENDYKKQVSWSNA